MDHQKIYDDLINRAKNRLLEGYVEKHHVIPKCMGGSNDEIVTLTPEEHYIAHQLLIKMYPDEPKLIYAAKMMTIGERRNNKLYGWLRRKFIKNFSGEKNPMYGKSSVKGKTWEEIYGVEGAKIRREKQSEAHKGKKLSIEHKKQISKTLKGNIPWNKDKIGVMPKPWNKGKTGLQVAWNKGIPRTEQEKRNISLGKKK